MAKLQKFSRVPFLFKIELIYLNVQQWSVFPDIVMKPTIHFWLLSTNIIQVYSGYTNWILFISNVKRNICLSVTAQYFPIHCTGISISQPESVAGSWRGHTVIYRASVTVLMRFTFWLAYVKSTIWVDELIAASDPNQNFWILSSNMDRRWSVDPNSNSGLMNCYLTWMYGNLPKSCIQYINNNRMKFNHKKGNDAIW